MLSKTLIKGVALSLLMGGFLSSCRQDVLQQSSREDVASRSTQRFSAQISGALEVATFQQPIDLENGRKEARSVTYALGTKTDDLGTITSPKFKEVNTSVPVLCVIRSSNPAQPINYVQVNWRRKGNKGLVIDHDQEGLSLNFDPNQPLGNLTMMVILGGSYDQVTKRLSFASQIATAEGTNELSATLDVPYVSDWTNLEVENYSTDASKLRLKVAGYTADVADRTVIQLKPQGIVFSMRVENEMSKGADSRTVDLKKLSFRSTSYAGDGYYDLSEAKLRSGQNIASQWVFTDQANLKTTTYTLSSPLRLTYNASGRTQYNSYRDLYHYPHSPYLLCWMMPTGQQVSDIGTTDNNLYRVRTEVLAEVVDARETDTPGRTVYSNAAGVDAQEAAGKVVVPSMKALPVYASTSLAKREGVDAPFASGKAYALTLNVARWPMTLDLLSEYEVAEDGRTFTNDSYSNVAYYGKDALLSPTAISLTQADPSNRTSWRLLSFQAGNLIGGYINNRPARVLHVDNQARLYPNIVDGIGWNEVEKGSRDRVGAVFSLQRQGTSFVIYSLIYYPPTDAQATAAHRNASHLSIIKYESAGEVNGVVRMKMTQRYIGSYSLDAANIAVSSSDQQSVFTQDREASLRRIVALGSSYWDDPIRAQDDVVRYFPLLGYKLASDPSTVLRKNLEGYLLAPYLNGNFTSFQGQISALHFNAKLLETMLWNYDYAENFYETSGFPDADNLSRGENAFQRGSQNAPIRLMRSDLTLK